MQVTYRLSLFQFLINKLLSLIIIWQAAFRHAVAQFNRMNESASGRRFELQAFVDIISTADTVKLSKLSKFFFSVELSKEKGDVFYEAQKERLYDGAMASK